jgi:hypothetical protein
MFPETRLLYQQSVEASAIEEHSLCLIWGGLTAYFRFFFLPPPFDGVLRPPCIRRFMRSAMSSLVGGGGGGAPFQRGLRGRMSFIMSSSRSSSTLAVSGCKKKTAPEHISQVKSMCTG